MIIYKSRNKINGKIYIGQTIQNFDQYKSQHISCAEREVDKKAGKTRSFYEAIRKYGKEKFEWEIIEQCDSKSELNKKEIFYIDKYNSYYDGYNMTFGGEGGSGVTYERTDEIRKKISDSLKGHKRSKSSIKKQIKTMSGKNHPLYGIGHKKDSIEKMRKSKMGKKNPASKKYKIISPCGKEYIIEGGFNKFCLKNHIWHNGLRAVAQGKKQHHKGWKAILLI